MKNLRSNKYSLNHNYFDVIDNEEKAYCLGFLFADGNVCKNGYYINIDLAKCDVGVLDYFVSLMYSEKPPYIKRQIDNCQYLKLTISSKHMAHVLIEHGCVPAKTKVLEFPRHDVLPQKLYRHFIRGYFDGDGSITFRQGNPMVFLLGNKGFLECVKKEFLEHSINKVSIITDREYYRLQITNLRDIYWFYNYIYSDIASYCLERKKSKLDSVYEKLYLNKDKIKSSLCQGVCFDKSRDKWRVTYGKKSYGRFFTEEEAINRRREIELNEGISNGSKNSRYPSN